MTTVAKKIQATLVVTGQTPAPFSRYIRVKLRIIEVVELRVSLGIAPQYYYYYFGQ
ncbi:MAG: hypothetical protein VB097_02765 [Rikenellaceae bacterium]|nr:hypothetical protein [Rikenellaceae bacterium]